MKLIMHLSFPLLKLLNNPFPNGTATRYQSSNTLIKESHQLPKVEILNLAKGNIAIHNPLNQDKLPKGEVR